MFSIDAPGGATDGADFKCQWFYELVDKTSLTSRRKKETLETQQRKATSDMKTASNEWLPKAGFPLAMITAAFFAQAQTVPRPVLSIAQSGSNQLTITVTNGVSYGNYTLYEASVLNSTNYPWLFVTNPVPGVSNFTVDTEPYFYNFFLVTGGTNWNQGGVPNWDLADPKNPSLGALTVTIVSPTNNSTIQ